jgi:hypothetical protein
MNHPLEGQTGKRKCAPGNWKGIVEACAAFATTITVSPHAIDDGLFFEISEYFHKVYNGESAGGKFQND